jgi:hypothetical protein
VTCLTLFWRSKASQTVENAPEADLEMDAVSWLLIWLAYACRGFRGTGECRQAKDWVQPVTPVFANILERFLAASEKEEIVRVRHCCSRCNF